MRLGVENKRQVYLLIALCAVLAAIAVWDSRSVFSRGGGKALSPAALSRRSSLSQHAAESAGAAYGGGVQPALRIGELARSEQMALFPAGRDIFAPRQETIEAPIAPPRPVLLPAAAAPPEAPKPPALDIKYLGYTQMMDNSYSAVLALGDDSLSAKSGEVIFHHYRVNSIQPVRVQVTDLSFNNTQFINLTEN